MEKGGGGATCTHAQAGYTYENPNKYNSMVVAANLVEIMAHVLVPAIFNIINYKKYLQLLKNSSVQISYHKKAYVLV